MKNLILKFIFVILSFLMISGVKAQDCITFHSDYSGLEWDDTERQLITTAACELKTLIADAGVTGFKVHTFGFYGYNPNMTGGTEAVWNEFLSARVNTSTPHLAIGKEINLDGSFKKFWVSFDVPTSGYFNCMSASDKNALKSQLETFGSSGTPNPSALAMLNWLKTKLTKLKSCCNVATSTLTCSDCQYSLAEAEAKLIEKGFYKIEAENISTSPSIYIILQSSIKITYSANGNSINLTDELESFLGEVNGTGKVTTFNKTNCQGLADFTSLSLGSFDYAEDVVLLDFDGKKALYTNYSSLCVAGRGKRALPIVIWALRKAGQIAAGVVIDLGLEVLIEKWVGGHASFSAAFEATDIGCSEVMSAIGDNTFKSKIGEAIWEATKPSIDYVIKTPSANWTWPGMGTAVEKGIQDALLGQILGKFADKFTKSLGRLSAFQTAGRGGANNAKINLLLADLKEIVKTHPGLLPKLNKAVKHWTKLNSKHGPIAKLIRKNGNTYDYMDKLLNAKFGAHFATFNTYNENFRKKFGIPTDQVVVHHAVERQAFETKYKSLKLTESEMNSLENLRGIPKDVNSEIHLKAIRKRWNEFYSLNPDGPNMTKQKLLDFAKKVDDEFGHLFLPPIR